jgi:hypothetical protein
VAGNKTDTPWKLAKKVDLPAGKKSTLSLWAAVERDKAGWDLAITADGKVLAGKTIAADTTREGWLEVNADLSEYAGRTVLVELTGQAVDKNAKQPPGCTLAGVAIKSE